MLRLRNHRDQNLKKICHNFFISSCIWIKFDTPMGNSVFFSFVLSLSTYLYGEYEKEMTLSVSFSTYLQQLVWLYINTCVLILTSQLQQCSKLRLKRSHMRPKLWFCDLNLRKVAELRTKFKTSIESVFVWSGEFIRFYTDSFSDINIMLYVKVQEFRINVNNSW